MPSPVKTQSWKRLENLAEGYEKDGFSNDEFMSSKSCGGLSLNLSHSLISPPIWTELFTLARDQAVEIWRDKMYAMDPINISEGRAVGHMRLRDGKSEDVQAVLKNMKAFVEKTHNSDRFTDVVHIGIGGSDLGPRMVCEALRHLPHKLRSHFVSNVDAADIEEVLKQLTPDTTLFVIASKTFTTQETMMNAGFAKSWLGACPTKDHMIALSTNNQAVQEFGITPENMFPFWDWVGGRFSLWSAIGMPIALTYGFDVFAELLEGARQMDEHFLQTPLEDNIPVVLALFGVWNRNFMNRGAVSVLPYAQNLKYFVDFLQQLDMESNGKSVDRDGNFITEYKTGPVVFGQVGTNGQHAFHQWLHQGTDIVPCEFICVESSPYNPDHQRVLNAHAQAQVVALVQGDHEAQNTHKYYAGGRPCVTITLDSLSPSLLGQLVSLYEHKIFVQGIIWNINSFDQFGVELGKKMAQQILAH